MKAALALGADVNLASKNGDTALHVAVNRGFRFRRGVMAKSGAHLDAKNVRGVTPIAAATRLGHDATIEAPSEVRRKRIKRGTS